MSWLTDLGWLVFLILLTGDPVQHDEFWQTTGSWAGPAAVPQAAGHENDRGGSPQQTGWVYRTVDCRAFN